MSTRVPCLVRFTGLDLPDLLFVVGNTIQSHDKRTVRAVTTPLSVHQSAVVHATLKYLSDH